MGLLLLTACETSGTGSSTIKYDLAGVPNDIRSCFTKLTGKPQKGVMSEREAAALIAALRKSEVRESNCGKRLLAIYDGQVVNLRAVATRR